MSAEQKFWVERILFGAVLFIKLFLIFRTSRSDWPYTVVFCIAAIAGWFAFISPAYKDPSISMSLTQIGYFMSIITTITTGVYIIHDKPNSEGWIRPTFANLTFFMVCAGAILFVLYKVAPVSRFRTDAQLDSLNKKVDRSVFEQKINRQESKNETQEVKSIAVDLAKGLTLSLANQSAMRQENEILKQQLAATNRTVNRSAATLNTVQQKQEETQVEVKAVQEKVDSVKVVVAAGLPADTVSKDTARRDVMPQVSQDSLPARKRGLWKRVFGRKG